MAGRASAFVPSRTAGRSHALLMASMRLLATSVAFRYRYKRDRPVDEPLVSFAGRGLDTLCSNPNSHQHKKRATIVLGKRQSWAPPGSRLCQGEWRI